MSSKSPQSFNSEAFARELVNFAESKSLNLPENTNTESVNFLDAVHAIQHLLDQLKTKKERNTILNAFPSTEEHLEFELLFEAGEAWELGVARVLLRHIVEQYDGADTAIPYVGEWLVQSPTVLLKPYPLHLNASEPQSYSQWMDFFVKLSIQLHLKFEAELGSIQAREAFIDGFDYCTSLFYKKQTTQVITRLLPYYLLTDSLLEDFNQKQLETLVLDKKNELNQMLQRITALEQTVLEQDFLLDKYREETDRAVAVKSKFLNNMSHEIRTPMTTILGYADLLMKHTDNAERVRDFAEVIQGNASGLMDLMDDFIEISKLESGVAKIMAQRFRFSELFEFQMRVENLFPSDSPVTLAIDIERTISEIIEGDKEKILQVLVHLVQNARRFTREGEVHVYFDIDRRDKVINLKVSEQQSHILEQDVEHIFEEFYHVEHDERSSVGTSLGLSIVRRLVDLLGGSIKLTTHREAGSVIFVQIPVIIINRSEMMRNNGSRSDRRIH